MDIIYQDSRIVVGIKPVGVLAPDEPGGMPELLRRELGTECIRSVHRLDAQVSGLMVYARSSAAAGILSEQIRQGELDKEYLAIVHGAPPERGDLEDLLRRDRSLRKTFVADAPGKNVRPARLSYEVLDRRDGLSLVRIRLHTGRTHQIRVQFQSRGWPLWGDGKYGTDGNTPIALFSCTLAFRHPEDGKAMRFTAIPPEIAPWDLFSHILRPQQKKR